MLLTIDVGNTVVTLGVFEGSQLTTTLRVATDTRRLADEYGAMLTNVLGIKGVDSSLITAACICSVVPPLTVVFNEVCDTFFGVKPLVVSAGVRTGLPILYDNPRDVGADRIADAVAAIQLYGTPLVVVDLGTASVFDAISREGEYLGGAIAPGINLAADSLFFNTSQLRRVELVAPKSAIGRSTVTSLQSGLVLGYAGLVTSMVGWFKDEIGQDARVIGTGGLINVITQNAPVFDHINQDLTLVGLRLIHEMNQGNKPTGEGRERTTSR
ncbi:MAG: type III pantothenate kinase [Chloroflexi bacterium]|nr:type III pantothenate kinase [Chloroflexota bacterium]MDA1218798.1 type III pantothenate kinase [Chloroflexota bacterium]